MLHAVPPEALKAESTLNGPFATGGIVTKLMAADFLLRRGRRMFLCNGFELSTAVQFLIHGEQTLETLFEPRPKIAG